MSLALMTMVQTPHSFHRVHGATFAPIPITTNTNNGKVFEGEFVQGGKVRGRELASIVPAGDEKDTMPGPDMPGGMGRSGVRVEMLKGGEYLRIWIARADHDYLIHLPPQSAAK